MSPRKCINFDKRFSRGCAQARISMLQPRYFCGASLRVILNAQLGENVSAKFTRVESSTLGAYRANLSVTLENTCLRTWQTLLQ